MDYELEYLNENVDNVLNNFTILCKRLSNNIFENKPITAESLCYFSKFTRLILRSSINFKVDDFDFLCLRIRNYWCYNLASETDRKRGCSYIQLYQMVMMIKQKYENEKSEHFVCSVMKDYSQDFELIKTIKTQVGITFKKLCNLLPVTPEFLKQRLSLLEEQSFVSARGGGDWRYYILTSLGDILYRNLYLDLKKHNEENTND